MATLTGFSTSRPRTAAQLQQSVYTGRGVLRTPRLVVLVILVALVILIGRGADSTLQYGLTLGIVYGLAILGGNLVVACLGEVNLATGASMAVGAYAFTWFDAHSVPATLAILLAALTAAVIGLVLAIPTVRLTGVFTALVTFALAFAVPDLITELSSVTGGQNGAAPDLSGRIFGFDPNQPGDLFTLAALIFLVLAAAVLVVFHGRIGRTALAVGEARRAAESYAVPRSAWAIGVWTVSALLAGVSGALLAILVGFVTPSEFPVLLSITLLVGSFAGGVRSPVGALIGGLLVGTVPPQIQSVIPASATSLALGVVLLVVLIAGGGGLGGVLEKVGVVLFTRARRFR